jgi:quinone-reactive Ni/Fe-hydrogenase large subunit
MTIWQYACSGCCEKYSWCKAPNYDGKPFEVGPLARMVVGYAQGDERIKPLIDNTLKATGLPAKVLFSTLGRTAARTARTVKAPSNFFILGNLLEK